MVASIMELLKIILEKEKENIRLVMVISTSVIGKITLWMEKKMKYFNEDIYIGNWKNNMKERKGLFLWKNGDKYDGDWKNDKKEGEGKMVYQDGKEENGNFKNDKFDKKLFGFW